MDRRRKCILTKLRTLLNILDEEEGRRTCGDADSFKGNTTVSREKYPTCPAMKRNKCRPQKEIVPFESTLRDYKAYPLVPCREKRVHSSFSNALCIKPRCRRVCCYTSNISSFNGMCGYCPRPSGPPTRCRRARCASRRSPNIYVIKEEGSLDVLEHPPVVESCENNFFSSKPRVPNKRPYSVAAPARCTQSKELRGGILHLGCDCDKTNGLQDRCLRFCCLRNPKCKHRPAACYLSRFSGGRHLPNIDFQKPVPTYKDFNSDSHTRTIQIFDQEDEAIEIEPSYNEEPDSYKSNSRYFSKRYHPYDYEEHSPRVQKHISHEKICYIPVPSVCPTTIPVCPRTSCRSFRTSVISPTQNTCCSSYGRKIFKIPQVVCDSPDNSFNMEPTKVCVVCPLSYIESPCDYSVEW